MTTEPTAIESRPSIRDLADRYGTPAYHYELDEVDASVPRLRSALPEPATLLYSLKANPRPLIARTLREAGCHTEISSSGELAVAREAGFRGEQCLYTGPGKSIQEITTALSVGVRRFSVEWEADYQTVATAAAGSGRTTDCLIRVNALRARGASSLRMSGVASQFGVDASTSGRSWSRNGRPAHVAMVVDHIVADGYGLNRLRAELAALLGGDDPDGVRWLGRRSAPTSRARRRQRSAAFRPPVRRDRHCIAASAPEVRDSNKQRGVEHVGTT